MLEFLLSRGYTSCRAPQLTCYLEPQFGRHHFHYSYHHCLYFCRNLFFCFVIVVGVVADVAVGFVSSCSGQSRSRIHAKVNASAHSAADPSFVPCKDGSSSTTTIKSVYHILQRIRTAFLHYECLRRTSMKQMYEKTFDVLNNWRLKCIANSHKHW